jgi:RNA polymerase sigma factor (sigma-70 family)
MSTLRAHAILDIANAPASAGPVIPLTNAEYTVLSHILDGKMEYIPDTLFEQPDAERVLFEESAPIALPDTTWYHAVMENLGGTQARGPRARVLLSAEQERTLFLQYNYCRYRAVAVRDQLGEGEAPPSLARELLRWHGRAKRYRDQIAEANLALVLAMAKRVRSGGVDFAELVSEGNMALLRAVDKFDASRGFKFSTFACRAIMKALGWMGVKLSKYRQLFPTDLDQAKEESNHARQRREEHQSEYVAELRDILRENRASLSGVEREVREHRFALGRKREADPEAEPMTLEQVGHLIGMAKGRVRKIQNKALQKIAHTLGTDFMI